MKKGFFHILNRGVEKRKIFLTKDNYLRFVYNLNTLNNRNIALPHRDRLLALQKPGKKEEIVDILCWCLMPNHPHIFVQEQVDGGASLLSKKLICGYTHYFNLQSDRKGVLFQGRSKIISIKHNAHFIHIPYYILSNPIELVEPKWKEKGIKNLKKVIAFLENYKYSSFPDIIGKDNFPEIINKKLFYDVYETNETRFRKDFIEWLMGFGGNFNDSFED